MQFEYDSPDIFDVIRSLDFGPLQATFHPYRLEFNRPSRTSRGVMNHRDIWILKVWEKENPEVFGLGECAPLPGLSIDTPKIVEDTLIDVCHRPNEFVQWLSGGLDHAPSVNFALEQALIDLHRGGKRILFPSKFTQGNEQITINGLIWMGNPQFMIDQINEKIHSGFRCIKMKIGGISFNEEIKILQELRNTFGYDEIEIRLDANGAFHPDDAIDKLEKLAPLNIHSIEQPIQPGQWEDLADLCRISPIPIALDEELIGEMDRYNKQELLETIMPAYIILKPSLLGGLQHTAEWIELAEEFNIGWWITSALESNIGLNAIAQWTFTLQNPIPQGLGTGQLFKNNFDSPLYIIHESLMFDPDITWNINLE
jgi:o-succinylbenzoate synthase